MPEHVHGTKGIGMILRLGITPSPPFSFNSLPSLSLPFRSSVKIESDVGFVNLVVFVESRILGFGNSKMRVWGFENSKLGFPDSYTAL